MPPSESAGSVQPFTLAAFLALALILLSIIVLAPPPEPHGIAGWIFDADGSTQMPLGTWYSINDTNTSSYVENVTRIPFPGYTGRYSETVNGSDNDTIIIRAWNASHWGSTTVLLVGDMDNVNVSLNGTRPGEPNITVLTPADNTLYELNDTVSIQANLSITGANDAVNCNATVTFSTAGVITLNAGEDATQLLGNLSPGSVTLVNWTANASSEGATDITVEVLCDDEASGFDTTDSDTAGDINVQPAVPPEPHGIAGWIFRQDGVTQVPLGTFYEINDTTSGFYMQNQTRIPFPGYTGRYSETIDGNDGDTVNLTAWNSTHYGMTSVTLVGDMDNVNISLNLTRPSETNVSIIFPPNATGYPQYRATNVTARVQIIGGQNGTNCSATVSFANESVLNITSSESFSKSVGNITLWDSTLVSWNVTAAVGTTNVTVNASCDSDARNFEGLDSETILANITFPSLYLTQVAIESPVDLQAGTNVSVRCNATVYNENLAVNISLVNATLYDQAESSSGDSDDNNHHYTNASCEQVSAGGFEANYTCSFTLTYYANNGTWECNVTAYDGYSFISNSTANTTYVNSLFSLSSGTLIDFGSMQPTNTSSTDVNLTATNLGNMDFNLSVYGYSAVIGDGMVMNCTVGNITPGSMRYSERFSQSFSQMYNLTNESTMMTNFTLFQRTEDAAMGNDRNNTYWKLQVPINTEGQCNGTVTLQATA